jgi:hypothetical protein
MVTKGLCRGITGVLRLTNQTRANPEITGYGNIININIKTSKESLTRAQEVIPLKAQPTADRIAEESVAPSTRRLRHSRTHF